MDYSFLKGIWKTIENGLVFFGPSIIAFIANLPIEYQTQYAPLLGLILYFLKNYIKVKMKADPAPEPPKPKPEEK